MNIRLTTAEYRGAYAALMILKMRRQLSIDQPDEGSFVKHFEKQALYDSLTACKVAGLIESFNIPECTVVVRGVALGFDNLPKRIFLRFVPRKKAK